MNGIRYKATPVSEMADKLLAGFPLKEAPNMTAAEVSASEREWAKQTVADASHPADPLIEENAPNPQCVVG